MIVTDKINFWLALLERRPDFRRAREQFLALSLGRVVLLGFAYRHISVKFTQKTRKPSQPKPLPASVKTMADWIRMKLHEHGMAPHQLGFKMGIAAAVVNGWKDGLARPKPCHVREMVCLLGKYHSHLAAELKTGRRMK
jgi:ribosome-binding protein aMBF1 (putative translation factor)